MESRRLGNAAWISPAAFAERCPYEHGTFWVGRSPETGEGLGYIDDRHILLGSGTRAGKGTTIILNNLCVWPGSVVVVDPKGENATVTAARRGAGSDYCEGMGQTVRVLDPFSVSNVGGDVRGCYNPLDELDPTDPEVVDTAAKIASAIVVEQKGLKEPFWKESARKMVKGVILHVLTSPRYEGRRNLVTVRELIARGDVEGAEMLRAAGKKGVPSGHELLWEGMSVNEDLGGVVAATGDQMAGLVQADAKLFHSMLQSVDRETEWLDSPLMRQCVASSNFKLSDLKRDRNGISVYLCMPEGHMTEHSRWLRMMLTLVVQTVEAYPERPATGHRILMVMDEFLALDRIKAVERAASYVAGFHLTMVFVVQGLSELQETYGKGWENIVGNCGLKIFFAVDEPFAREYVSKMIGDTEIRPEVRTSGSGISTNKAHTCSVTESDTDSTSMSRSHGKSKSKSTTGSRSHTDSMTSGTTRSRGVAATYGRAHARTDSINESTADTRGSSQARSRTSTLGWNDAVADGTNWNKSSSLTEGDGSTEGGSWSPRKLVFRNTDTWTHWLRENETANRSINRSSSATNGTVHGESHTTTSGRSGSSSEGFTASQSQSETNTTGRGRSFSDSENHSLTFNETESEARSVSASDTVSYAETVGESEQVTDTIGNSKSHTTAQTNGTTEGRGEHRHQSVSESVHARRLVPAEDIGRLFDRPAPGELGFALVIVGGGYPTVAVRSPYYNDQFFRWLFDPHPDHGTPPKMVGPEKFCLPGSEVDLMARLELLKTPGEMVRRGEPIAELSELLTAFDDFNETYLGRVERVSPASYGFPDPLPIDLRLTIRSQVNGKVLDQVDPELIHGFYRDDEPYVLLEVNRLELSRSGLCDTGDDLDRYGAYLLARKEREAQGRDDYQAARTKLAQAEVDRVTAVLLDIEKEIEQDELKLATSLINDDKNQKEAEERAREVFAEWERSVWATSEWPYVAITIGVSLVSAAFVYWVVATKSNTWAAFLLAVSVFIVACWGIGYWLLDCVYFEVGESDERRIRRAWDEMHSSQRCGRVERALDRMLHPNSAASERERRAAQRKALETRKAERECLAKDLERAVAYAAEVAKGLPEGRTPPLLPARSSKEL